MMAGVFSGRFAPLTRFAAAAASVYLFSELFSRLAVTSSCFSFLWPLAGVSLALTYFWRRPAVLGIFVGTALFAASSNWQWFDLARNTTDSGPSFVQVLSVLAVCVAAALQAWVSARFLRAKMPAIVSGTVRTWGWTVLMILVGPVACLIKSGTTALLFGWISIPFQPESAVFWLAMWLANTLSTLTFAPIIIIRELRVGTPNMARSWLRSPWLALVLVTSGAWLLAGYADIQQASREQQRFRGECELLRREVQISLDDAEQKLKALRALYRVSRSITREDFDRFANELLEDSPYLLGLGWARRVAHADRPAIEAQLTVEAGHAVRFSEFGTDDNLVPEAVQGEYWPLMQVSPDGRKGVLGFDLISEPRRRRALLQSLNGNLAVSTRVVTAREDGQHAPTVFLYLATEEPARGVVVAPLKIDALLTQAAVGQHLLDLRHGLTLADEKGGVWASLGATRGAAPTHDADLDQRLPLKLGDNKVYLTVATDKTALPYMTAPLWWLGQLLPQLGCVVVAILIALGTANDKKLLHLERQYASYIERQQHEAGVVSDLARRFDTQIEQGWRDRAFEPGFEPIVDLRTGEIRGAEALLRWKAAPTGLLTSDIIDWAERKHVIGELDQNMLSASLRALAAWPIARTRHFMIAVNVSATELQNPTWASQVMLALDHANVPGRRLCIEITEGILVRSDSLVLSQLGVLRAAGVHIALDDFGTGYSSMAYLRQLPVDRIKLDRAFVSELATDIKARQIVASIVSLGSSLGIDLVAEAVEDLQTAQILLELGCTLAQGRLFSETLSMQTMQQMIRKNTSLMVVPELRHG